MNNIKIENDRTNFFKLKQYINIDFNSITDISDRGKNIILISNEELKNIKNTLYITSIPSYVDQINRIRQTENWDECEEYKIDEQW